MDHNVNIFENVGNIVRGSSNDKHKTQYTNEQHMLELKKMELPVIQLTTIFLWAKDMGLLQHNMIFVNFLMNSWGKKTTLPQEAMFRNNNFMKYYKKIAM